MNSQNVWPTFPAQNNFSRECMVHTSVAICKISRAGPDFFSEGERVSMIKDKNYVFFSFTNSINKCIFHMRIHPRKLVFVHRQSVKANTDYTV